MPSLKDLRGRIRSVKNTQQITKTMKMVAAAKVRRATESCEAARPFAERLNGVLTELSKSADSSNAPLLLVGRDTVKTVRVLALSSDRGLCGGFNAQITKETTHLVHKLQEEGKKVEIVTLGRKIKDQLKREFGDLIIKSYDNYTRNISYALAEEVAYETIEALENGQCDQVLLAYNQFISMMTQTPHVHQLAPFAVEGVAADDDMTTLAVEVEYEPNEHEVLSTLLPKNVVVQVFGAMLESFASEQAARMTAMDSATRNAGDMIKNLTLQYNRSRQAAITKELVEIISGAEAL